MASSYAVGNTAEPSSVEPRPPGAEPEPPFGYGAFGLSIASDFVLPSLSEEPLPPPAAPDVRVVRTAVPSEASEGDNGEDSTLGLADGVLRTRISGGSLMEVEQLLEADASFVSAVIAGELMTVVLRQRGFLVLHGSAVAKGGQAVGFIGHSGWGKSTLAATLIQRGWRLLTDDVLVVTFPETGPPLVVPGHASMRLADDAAERLTDDPDALPVAHALTDKRRVVWAEAFSEALVPLDRLYVLDPRGADAHAAVPLGPRDALAELAVHTRGSRMLRSDGHRAKHLAQCAAVIRAVPVARLVRRSGLDHLPALCDLVEAGSADPAAEGR